MDRQSLGSKRLSQDEFFPLINMKKSFAIYMLICCYILQKFSQKWWKIVKKKRASKRSKELNIWFFLPPSTYSLGFLPWLKLDFQTRNGQRLTSVAQSTNKSQLIKYLFSCFFKVRDKCRMQCCIARNFSRKP